MINRLISKLSCLFTKKVQFKKIISNSKMYGQVIVGEHCLIDRWDILANCKVSIGEWTILTGPGKIVSDMYEVKIGKFCSIAPGVQILESSHEIDRITTFYIFNRIFNQSHKNDISSKGPITIGHDVWIGTNSVILSGVKIGNGAVIAAGAIVNKDIEPYAVVAGVPAKVKKMRFSESQIKLLEEIAWWNWDLEKIKKNKEFFKLVNPSADELAQYTR